MRNLVARKNLLSDFESFLNFWKKPCVPESYARSPFFRARGFLAVSVLHWQMDMSLVALACMLLRTKSSIRSASCASGPDMDDWTMDQGDQRAGAKFNHKCHVALAVHLLAWSEICFVLFRGMLTSLIEPIPSEFWPHGDGEEARNLVEAILFRKCSPFYLWK